MARRIRDVPIRTDTSALLGLASRIPILSEAEEARALQYRCECLEAALFQQGESTQMLPHLIEHDHAQSSTSLSQGVWSILWCFNQQDPLSKPQS